MLERPTSGQVTIDGQDLTALPEKSLTRARRGIRIIFQHFNLLSSRNFLDNVALPLALDNTPKEKIKARLDKKMLIPQIFLGDKNSMLLLLVH